MHHSQTDTPQRQPALDAVRAAALLLGIFLHAGLSFVPTMNAQLWPISDSQKSAALDVTVFVIHIFRMSVFFLVAGFLAHGLYCRLGVRGFVRNRTARILLPLLMGWILCFSLIVAVVLWAHLRSNGGQLPRPLPADKLDDGLNFLHLWFLYMLLWLYATALALKAVWRALNWPGHLTRLADAGGVRIFSTSLAPLLLALPVSLALFFLPGWTVAVGIPTPAYTLVPPLGPWFVYAYVFMLGWWLARHPHLLGELARRWLVSWVWGLAATLVCLYLRAGLASQSVPLSPADKFLHASGYGLALVGWTLTFVGAGVRFLSGPSARFRYLADASYWMYIAHLPLVMALQTALMLSPWHWSIKYVLINVLCVAFLLATYHYGVRPTWVGQLLSGRRVARVAASKQALAA